MKQVTVFVINNCPYCEKLEKLLTEANIEFDKFDVETDEGTEKFKPVLELTKTEMFPTILVNDMVLAPKLSFTTIDMAFNQTVLLINRANMITK